MRKKMIYSLMSLMLVATFSNIVAQSDSTSPAPKEPIKPKMKWCDSTMSYAACSYSGTGMDCLELESCPKKPKL